MKKSSIILALALAASAWTALGQPSGDGSDQGPNGPPTRHRHRPPPLPLLKALDTNSDGIIDAQEIANAPANLLKLDKNGDGKLEPDEYMPPRPDGSTNNGPPPDAQGHHRPPPPLVAALDTNGDGIIDANEIANASANLLKLDKNGDGKLEPDEYRPHHPPPDGPPPGDDNGGNGDGPPGGPPPQ